MKRWIVALMAVLLLVLCADAMADVAPVNMEEPPEAIATQAEGELESYGLTFPEEMPLAARNFVLLARAQFEKNDWAKLPKNNEYTKWYYQDNREIGWCSVFQLWCAYHSGMQLIRYRQGIEVPEGACISAMEGRVGNVYLAFEEQGRWLDGTQGAVPKPGYLVIYGQRDYYAFVHVGLVTDVVDRGDGVYQVFTVEGNMSSRIKRYCYLYDSNAKADRNMSATPENERTEPDVFQYTPHKNNWYVNEFCQTWY